MVSASGIRNVVVRRGLSGNPTVRLVVQSKADLSSVTYTDPNVYSSRPDTRKQTIDDVFLFAAGPSDLDAQGAESIELASWPPATSLHRPPPDLICQVGAATRAPHTPVGIRWE